MRPFAGEHEKPKRAADELDCDVEQADGARGAVDDESEDAAGSDRVEEKYSPDAATCRHAGVKAAMTQKMVMPR